MTMTDDVIVQTKPFPGVWKSVVWILIYLVLQVGVTVAVMGGVFASHPELMGAMKTGTVGAMGTPIVAQAVLWGLLLSGLLTLALFWWNLRKDDRAARIGLTTPSLLSPGKTLGLGLALVAGVTAFNWAYTTYIIPGVELQDELKALLKALSTGKLNIFLKYLAVAGIAPIIEELLFRGYLQNAFKRSMNFHAAIWLAAFFFALIHFQLPATPALMVMGAAFGYLYHYTGSLKTNIGLHMLNNALALYFTA
jgi:uncharacterized protein